MKYEGNNLRFRTEQTTAQHILDSLADIVNENKDLINEYFSVSQMIEMALNSYSFVFYDDNDEVICIGGILPLVPHIGNFWFLWTHRLKKNVLGIVKQAKQEIEIARKRLDIHRLESYVMYGRKNHYKLNKAAGFKLECDKIEMGDSLGNNFHLFVKIWPKES